MTEYEQRRARKFWSYVQKSEGCWVWTGAVNKKNHPFGYGQFRWLNGKRLPAHRVSLLISGMDVPKDKFACHKCDNPKCVRPDHLFFGTAKDNMQDATRKGRIPGNCRPPGRSHRSLTEQQVLQILNAVSENGNFKQLAEKFGVYYDTVLNVKNGIYWKWFRPDLPRAKQPLIEKV